MELRERSLEELPSGRDDGESFELERVGRRWTLFLMKTFKDIIDFLPPASPSDFSDDLADLTLGAVVLELSWLCEDSDRFVTDLSDNDSD